MITISQALEGSAATLVKVSDTPTLDAQTILAHCLGKSRTWLLTHPEESLTNSAFSSLQQEINALEKGIPLPYVLGHWEFYGLDFTVTPDTLIPRPETELLVDKALDWLNLQPEPCMAADIGTGSGCIAVALAKHNPDVSVIATDISYPALKIGRANTIQHNVDHQVNFLQTDLFPPIADRFDLVCANLPYIPTQTLQNLEVSGREPDMALDGGPNGLDLISSLLEEAPGHIAPRGILLIEVESSQGAKAQYLAQRAFPSAEIEVLSDLSGKDRLVMIQLPKIY
ncbi:MAG: peptide chain release factor N(5)-glutamine methyltransferase [Chloroflexi bacterium]|nr:peptide chain release factor N(5)-glutamine methyltransferase [Chloroflexota bacterium]